MPGGGLTSSGEPGICIRVHKELHLKELSDLLGVKYKDALKQHYVRWVQGHKFILPKNQQRNKCNFRMIIL